MPFWFAAAAIASAAVSAYSSVKAGKAQAKALNGQAALNEKVAEGEARAVEVNGELDQRQAEAEADVVLRNATAEARYIDDTVTQEYIATGRERRDLAVERRKTLGRTRAAMAAAGYSTTEGSALEVITDTDSLYAIADERAEQDLNTTVLSLRNRKADVLALANYQAGYLRESGVFARAFATVRANDIREAGVAGSALAQSQASSIRSTSSLTAAGTLLGGAASAYKIQTGVR